MVDDVSGKATIQLYVKYNTTTLYRSNCEYNQSLKSFVTISIIFPSLLNILLIDLDLVSIECREGMKHISYSNNQT